VKTNAARREKRKRMEEAAAPGRQGDAFDSISHPLQAGGIKAAVLMVDNDDVSDNLMNGAVDLLDESANTKSKKGRADLLGQISHDQNDAYILKMQSKISENRKRKDRGKSTTHDQSLSESTKRFKATSPLIARSDQNDGYDLCFCFFVFLFLCFFVFFVSLFFRFQIP